MTTSKLNIEIPINNSATYNKVNKVNKLVTFFAFCSPLPRQYRSPKSTWTAPLSLKKAKNTMTNFVCQDNSYRDTPFAQTNPTMRQKMRHASLITASDK